MGRYIRTRTPRPPRASTRHTAALIVPSTGLLYRPILALGSTVGGASGEAGTTALPVAVGFHTGGSKNETPRASYHRPHSSSRRRDGSGTADSATRRHTAISRISADASCGASRERAGSKHHGLHLAFIHAVAVLAQRKGWSWWRSLQLTCLAMCACTAGRKFLMRFRPLLRSEHKKKQEGAVAGREKNKPELLNTRLRPPSSIPAPREVSAQMQVRIRRRNKRSIARAAARCRRHGSTAPVQRVPVPSRQPFFMVVNGTVTARV
ncbi:hypothetical protein FB451DRAFT_1177588 [Mycena latifolia]|nr:hypothetical protein FB451DRAFT_1177588 [Mycena latifolia]